ncbi:MAG: hypothetical protein GXP08_11615 [Gammaproteobacteria bacterium]|nr:hypothetical protein [Gammaproteobacteria bacterium]
MMTMHKKLTLLVIGFFLWGCDTTDLPPEHPPGIITGNVMAGVINGAQVTVYTFGNNRRIRLGGAVTDETGAYSVEIRSLNRPILIEVSGGHYKEQASGTDVALTDGQNLRAVARYQSQQPLHVIVTPLTHLATGLAEYNIDKGFTAIQAIENANNDINEFFAIDTQNRRPLDITNQNNALSSLNDDALYGFYLAGLSNWTAWASTKNQVIPHTVYTSIGLAQIAYNDIRFDGRLNGAGNNKAGTALMPLAVGVVPLNEDAYRAAFSLHMLAIANRAENKTGLQIADLQSSAEAIASGTSTLLGESPPLDLKEQAPLLTLTQAVDGYFSGLFPVSVDIGGFLGAERIEVSINNEKVGEIQPVSPLSIDTTPYPDDEYQIRLTAVDILGNEAFIDFVARFDNTAPAINVTSPLVTNRTTTQLTGTYSDNAAGVQTVVVMEQQATLLDNDTWTATIDITPGKNTIPINIFDFAGNQHNTETIIYLDTIPPVIDTTDKHSLARFSNGNGDFFERPLQDSNTTPLFFETSHIDLTGVPITRQALNNNAIPFFALNVSDQMGPDATTAATDITVRIQYEKNGEILTALRVLPAVNDEYLVPLVSEMLSLNWHQSSREDVHQVRIEVSDSVGNLSQVVFDFHADIYVPATFIENTNIEVTGLKNDDFTNTAFDKRSELNNLEFPSTTYTFTNNTSKAFYINFADNSRHTVEQQVEQLVREHLVRLKTNTEWRVGLMTTTEPCPDITQWENTATVYNWTGKAWQLKQVPTPRFGAPEAVFSDNLPTTPPATVWIDTPDFDEEYTSASIKIASKTLNYEYDYIASPASFTPPAAAYVFNWKSEDNSTTPSIITCPSKRYFQQRQTFSHESVTGYPKPTLSETIVPDTPTFSTSSFSVFNNNTAEPITAINGWYKIPTDHSITITKQVTTPALALYNDNVSNLSSFSSYTPNWNDKSITWQVNQNIEISFRHDAGETNIPSMSERNMNAGTDINTYEISR